MAAPTKRRRYSNFASSWNPSPVIPLSLSIARRCARLREQLKLQGKRVDSRSLDLIIAATALEHDLTLVTRNSKDYSDIPNLNLYPAQ
ncbi:MAG: type II toxin-antitoxin system VapC family toxin [Caldilineaceae bacterium]|nr:type II toxin-antitoxin system VapC family toxin [Caldilineaceae bacterium]